MILIDTDFVETDDKLPDYTTFKNFVTLMCH